MLDIQKKLLEVNGGISILYVEDEDETRQQYGDIFRILFQDVEDAADGVEALEKYEQKKYDIIITDLTMPKMNGVKLIENIRKINPEQHIIVMTAHNTDANLRSSIEFQIDGFLLKPVAVDKLFFLLHKICRLISLEKKSQIDDVLNIDSVLQNQDKALFLTVIDKFDEIKQEFGDVVKEPILKAVQSYVLDFGIVNESCINLQNGVGLCNIDKTYVDKILVSLDEFSQKKRTIEVRFDDICIYVGISYGVIIPKQNIDYLRENQEQLLVYIDRLVDDIKKDSESFKVVKMDMELSEAKKIESLKWLNTTIKALEQESIVPFYQKIVDINTLESISYEVYARIKEDDKYIRPEFFIDLSKKAGILEEISKAVFKKSFESLSETDYEIHINLYYLELSKAIEDYIVYICSLYKVEHSRIVLNIMNFQMTQQSKKMIESLLNFKKLGFKICLKEFGTSAIDISVLSILEPEYIKVKQELIERAMVDSKLKNVLTFLVSFAKDTSIKTVLVGVERHETLEMGRALGFEYAQGYLVEEPRNGF